MYKLLTLTKTYSSNCIAIVHIPFTKLKAGIDNEAISNINNESYTNYIYHF